jgi:hypothetical protein
MTNQTTSEDALGRLDALVGRWSVVAIGRGGERWPGEAVATFEWHSSGAHLVQTQTSDTPGAPDSVSIIGCDSANGTYYQLYSDDRGVCRVYGMCIDNTEWTLWRDGRPFPQRFTGRFEDAGRRIAGRWEKAQDGTNFTTDFKLTYVRVD